MPSSISSIILKPLKPLVIAFHRDASRWAAPRGTPDLLPRKLVLPWNQLSLYSISETSFISWKCVVFAQFFFCASLCSKRSVCVITRHFTVIADALLHAGGWLFSITSSATYQYIYVSNKRLYLLRYFKNYNIPSQVISFCCRNNNINSSFWTTFTKYFWVCYSSSNVDAVTFR